MPADAIYVGRPTKWGNPYSVADWGREAAVQKYRDYLQNALKTGALSITELSGKDLACWCPLDKACHADVLLEVVNA